MTANNLFARVLEAFNTNRALTDSNLPDAISPHFSYA